VPLPVSFALLWRAKGRRHRGCPPDKDADPTDTGSIGRVEDNAADKLGLL